MFSFAPWRVSAHGGIVATLPLAGATAIAFAGVRDLPVQLRAITVKADVPLVKVAEFTMCERRFAPASVVRGQWIYIIGGLNDEGVASKTVERFDTATGRSEIFARLRLPRFWHEAVVLGDKVHVIGGSVVGSSLPEQMEIEEAGAIVRGRRGAKSASVIRFVEIIDLLTKQVSQGMPLRFPVSKSACVAVDQQIAIIGGVVQKPGEFGVATDRVSIYETRFGGWTLGRSLPTALSSTAAVVHGPFVIVPGGYDGANALDVVQVHDLRDGTWRRATPLCRPTSAHSLVRLDQFLFLFGDCARPEELLVYDLAKETSETFTLGYTSARHTAAVTLERKIYVIGGRATRQSAPLKCIQVFALRKDLRATEGRRSDGSQPAPRDGR